MIWPEAVDFRLFQRQIADSASDRNTLVILPTAMGKTVISAMVAADILYQYRDAKVLVMAPTRPLVMQHGKTFLRFLKLRESDTAILTGMTPPDYRGEVWNGEARVLFATPQVVRNDLRMRRLSLEKFGLLVFDECHRAVKRYAYTEIARFYVSQARYPLILGMTASPGSDLNRVLDVCGNLYIEHVEYRTEEAPDVKPYIQSIEMEWRTVVLPPIYLAVRAQIRGILDDRVRWLWARGIVKGDPKHIYRRHLIEAGKELRYMVEESIEEERGIIFTAIVNQSLALTLYHMLELLETQGLHTLSEFMEKLELERREKRSYAILVNDTKYVALRELVENSKVEHPKARLMEKIVAEQISEYPSSRMLVFTQYRDTASHLVELLNSVQGVRAARFVGQASKLTDRGLTQDEQAERIRMLMEGELNVLVATSIGEEGLDIPAVDHVVFYEPIPSEIRYIQRRGRTGRRTAGKVSILTADGTMDMAYLNASRRRTEKMRRIVASANEKLQKIVRKRLKPPVDPMSREALKMLEGEALQITAEPEIVKREWEAFKEAKRNVERTARSLYLKLLERGSSGATVEQLTFDLETIEVTKPALEDAIERLTGRGLIAESDLGRYTATTALKEIGEIHEVRVNKVYRGFASVTVDDKWEAMLTPEDYDGPRSLIKKNSRFRASSALYSIRSTTYLKVKAVTKILS